jgi:o-succinylbenzoate---CoA ligase
MNDKPYSYPEFRPANGSLIFLESEDGSYTYSDLYGFSTWLSRLIDRQQLKFSKNQPLLICHPSSDEMVFLIAACFLQKVPFMVVHEDLSDADIHKLSEQISPPLVYTDRPESFTDVFDTISLHADQITLHHEAHTDMPEDAFDDPDSVAGLFLTSGSTGRAKIVPVKRRQVLFAADASSQNFKPGQNRFWLLCLPLNHVGGISIILRSMLYGSAVYRVSSFDVDQVHRFLTGDKRFEVASMVPTMLVNLMDDTQFKPHNGFRAILLGGGPISLELINWSITRGIPIVTSYGMTETFAQIAANPILQPSGIYHPKKSVGRPFEPNRIEIRDENGQTVGRGEQGQIWLRGPQLFDGYLSDELNKPVFDENGWFNTGDFGHLNHSGQLFIETRRTDLIITGGENVNPADVEAALLGWHEVDECAVIGVPDKVWGQRIVAFYTSSGQIDTEKVKQFLKNDLLGFQIPKEFIRVEKIPRTSLGKIKRRELVLLYGK